MDVSTDTRWNIVAMYNSKRFTYREIAHLQHVSASAMCKIIKLWKEPGEKIFNFAKIQISATAFPRSYLNFQITF
jgi:hypothetical protein